MNKMTVKFYDGINLTTWHDIINIQFLECLNGVNAYVITNVIGKRYTVYGQLINVE